MIVYGINNTKERFTDKTRMIVCSCEVKDTYCKNETMDLAIQKLKSADKYYEVTHWMTKEKYEELYK
jgi:hypothetical protein